MTRCLPLVLFPAALLAAPPETPKNPVTDSYHKDAIVTDFSGEPTVVATDPRTYAIYQLGGPSEVRVFDLEGKPVAGPKWPPCRPLGN